MSLHQTIKEQIKEALRAKDTIRLETLRGLNALFLNEMISSGTNTEFISDDIALTLIKRSIKQRKDSIEQFTKGGREDLVKKEKTELAILESFMPIMMDKEQIKIIVRARIEAMMASGTLDIKAKGKIIGLILKEIRGQADGNVVKEVVEDILSSI